MATQQQTDEKKTQQLYTPKNGYLVATTRLETIARILLMGVYDDDNILSSLRGMRFIVKAIWEFALDFNKHYWETYVLEVTAVEQISESWENIKFPKPKFLNINMMPFIMSKTFRKSKLPSNLKSYFPIILDCLRADSTQLNKICYLTVQESFVEKGRTQRRPGLHVECPGNIDIGQQENVSHVVGAGNCQQIFHPPYNPSVGSWHPWGRGHYEDKPVDGLYLASNVDNSCAVWNCKVTMHNDRDVIGHLGDIEHLRKSVSRYGRYEMGKNKLFWLTDRTPHEALAMQQSGYRQFFRLVTHNVAVWYEQHSSRNPNGVVPDQTITTIVKKNKFKQLPTTTILDIAPTCGELDKFTLDDTDKEIVISGGKITARYGMLFIICVDVVYLVHSELFERKKNVSGWNPKRGGSYVYEKILKKGSKGSLKKRKVFCELAAWNVSTALALEQSYRDEKKDFLGTDMKNGFKQKIEEYYDQCIIDNKKIPENPRFYKMIAECYPHQSRDKILKIIEIFDSNVNKNDGNDVDDDAAIH